MSKVYVLNGRCETDRYVVGVFSTMEKAEEEKQRIIKTDSYYRNYPDDLNIDEFALDVSTKS